MSGLALPSSLAQLTRCAGEETRYSLAGVQLTDPGGGQYRATVTDGRRLIHVQGYCPETKDQPAGELGCPPDVPVYVPSDAWNTIFRFAPKLHGWERNQYGEKTAPVRVARLSDGRVLLSSHDRTLTTDQLDGKFPDWRQIMPKGNPVAVVSVQPKLLAETLTALAGMLGEEFQHVTLCFFKPGEPIGLVAKNSVACIDALLMPLTPPEMERDYQPPAKVVTNGESWRNRKAEPQATVGETVEEFFSDVDDESLQTDPNADGDTESIEEQYELPADWTTEIVKVAVLAYYAQHGVTETPETPKTDEEPNA
jgi:hypothetical protein